MSIFGKPILTGVGKGSASGAIASFSDGAKGLPLRSLLVNIDPVQDLHEYDNPWPAGGGVNVFDALAWVTLDTNRIYYAVSSDETITVTANDGGGISNRLIDVSPGETYAFLSTFSTPIKIFSSNSQTIIQRVSGTFTAPDDGKIAVKFYASSYPTSGKFILVKGSTVPSSWTPYSNICPISGWSAVNVWRTGVNVWDEEWESGQFNGNPSTGVIGTAQDSTRIRTVNDIPVMPLTTYYVHSPQPLFAYFLDENKTWLNRVGSNGTTLAKNATFATPENCRFMKFFTINTQTYNHDISINYPSTDHDYHPYSGNQYTIQLGQTVYGGTLDVTNGALTVRPYYGSYNGETLVGPWISSMDAYAPGATPTTGAQVVDLGATPITIPLTATEISTLQGQNNVWADTGDVTVEYLKQTLMYIGSSVLI